ncbi:MAG TPA: NAD(P)/FAD-dependent oxidoreductase [Acidimicrobiia bacterium]|nr:NAD(P)/FAD-dependent oxidoreductase [Acidimicrobiia bacterium]
MPNVNGFDFDPVALKEKYDRERDKRLAMRPEGLAQYRQMTGELEHYAEDPYMPVEARDPKHAAADVVIVGGGFAGMLAAVRLIDEGVDDFVILERGGDFGGTWYWNRYPGAACDVESYIYLPLLEEVGTVPSMKYVLQPEILAHAQALGRKFDLYRRALMHTRVTDASFDDATSRWIVSTDRGDELRARFVILASGHYREPKLPGIPGIETFAGHSFHTSRWDYGYTGGAPEEPMDGLRDKVVGIIGTGATAIQCIPRLAKWAKHLYVFQRTPSSVDVRDNRPTDLEWFGSLEPGWQQKRMQNFVEAFRGLTEDDQIQDGWTQMMAIVRSRATPDMTMDDFMDLAQLVDYEMMENVRRRAETVVNDRQTSESLKPWYNWLCKRPCFHDEYLDVFNQDNVTLVDTDGRGMERVTEDAVFANGQEFKLDLLIFATGFELSPLEDGTPIPVTGRNGQTLAEKWKDGATTLHGQHVHGFPNFMLSTTRQASWDNNFPFPQEIVATHLAKLIRRAMDAGADTVEVTAQAEADWVRYHEMLGERGFKRWQECTPSYFNQEGTADARVLRNGSFGGSILEFREILRKWRDDDGMPGLVMVTKETSRP